MQMAMGSAALQKIFILPASPYHVRLRTSPRLSCFVPPLPPSSMYHSPYTTSSLQIICKDASLKTMGTTKFTDSESFTDSTCLTHSRLSFELLSIAKNVIMALTIFVAFPILFCGVAQASEAIKASSLGLKVASFLRQTGWPDEAVVFMMATLPVLELRGAIPVGYWMGMDPVKLSVLSVLGNMVPVPLIVLYMEKLATFLSNRSSTARKVVDTLFESTRKKAAPIQEFEWLGLMLFVAVPFPGTGAWTGAMAASVLGMPFWEAMSANFFGVMMAGLLVNLLVNLGMKSALMVGIGLFLISTFMWSFLRALTKSKQ